MWNMENPLNNTHETILAELPKIDNIPLDHFHKIISNLRNTKIEVANASSSGLIIVMSLFIGINIILFCGAGVLVILIYLKRYRKTKRLATAKREEPDEVTSAKLVVTET